MTASTKLGFLVLFIYFAGIIPKLRADPETNITLDTVWKQRREQAVQDALQAYNQFPHEATSDFNNEVGKSEEESKWTRRSLMSVSIVSANLTEGEEEELPKERVKYTGPCVATNPMDRCWRCQEDWADNRQRLASCALGFGRAAAGGKDGEFYEVTDDSDDNVQEPKEGTLRWGVIQNRPLWITFSRNMNIQLKQELIFTSHKTLDGRGANVHIAHGAGITIQFVKNVIIHNIHIHETISSSGGIVRDSEDHLGRRTRADGDGISIFGSSNIWLDHLTMYNCQDGLIDAIQGSTAITISNNYFYKHDHTILLGASDKHDDDKIMQVTVAFNVFGRGLIQRMPRCRWGFFHVVNNDYIQWQMYAIGGSSNPTIISQGNRFYAPDNRNAKEVTKRDYAPESEWENWTWRSEGDLMLNGAFFRQSGSSSGNRPTSSKDMLSAKPGKEVDRLTRFAGALDCRVGQPC